MHHEPYDSDNIFAKILRGEIPCKKIYENTHALSFYDINPMAKAHALVIPKGAYVSFADFSTKASDEEIAEFIRAVSETAQQIGVNENGYRLIANTGKHGKQEVPHFHLHICGGEQLGWMLPRD